MAGLAQGIDGSNHAGVFDWAGTSGLSFGSCRASQAWGGPVRRGGLRQGQTVVRFTDPAKTGVISARRPEAGEVVAGWEVS